jgi:hypothetical protein
MTAFLEEHLRMRLLEIAAADFGDGICAAMPSTGTRERERERARVFRPLAIELGWLVYEWNRLQAAIGELFAMLFQKTTLKFLFRYDTRSQMSAHSVRCSVQP